LTSTDVREAGVTTLRDRALGVVDRDTATGVVDRVGTGETLPTADGVVDRELGAAVRGAGVDALGVDRAAGVVVRVFGVVVRAFGVVERFAEGVRDVVAGRVLLGVVVLGTVDEGGALLTGVTVDLTAVDGVIGRTAGVRLGVLFSAGRVAPIAVPSRDRLSALPTKGGGAGLAASGRLNGAREEVPDGVIERPLFVVVVANLEVCCLLAICSEFGVMDRGLVPLGAGE
jgi:hypothetical protein